MQAKTSPIHLQEFDPSSHKKLLFSRLGMLGTPIGIQSAPFVQTYILDVMSFIQFPFSVTFPRDAKVQFSFIFLCGRIG